MELGKIARGSSKAQLMTIIMLVIFMLMLAVLFALAQLNITSNSAVQSIALSSASNNYGSLLRLSANNFAKESLSRALVTMVSYEYNPNLRRGNFISNMSFYVANLMVSGALPNDSSGYPQNSMGNLTFAVYANTIAANVLGFDSQNVVVSGTRPLIFQTDPYSIRASYLENISINASGNKYQYNIPVNVSISLNNTPDLFYAQQGITRPVKLASPYNLTSMIGGIPATAGNTLSYAYGTIIVVPSGPTYSANCVSPFVPTQFNKAPLNQTLIIATYNSLSLSAGSCIDKFAGLITYIPAAAPPSNVPYLIYPASSNIISGMTNGTKALVYGPGFATFDIENMRNAIMNHNYFASPYTSSYIDRANAQFAKQNPNGIFTFSNYDTQVASSNGLLSYVAVSDPTINLVAGKYNTVNFWMYWNGNGGDIPFGFPSYDIYLTPGGCFGFNTGNSDDYGISSTSGLLNKWVMVTAAFYNGDTPETASCTSTESGRRFRSA